MDSNGGLVELVAPDNLKVSSKLSHGNGDVKHSEGLTVDSLGRELSEQQQEYFKDSKIRERCGASCRIL